MRPNSVLQPVDNTTLLCVSRRRYHVVGPAAALARAGWRPASSVRRRRWRAPRVPPLVVGVAAAVSAGGPAHGRTLASAFWEFPRLPARGAGVGARSTSSCQPPSVVDVILVFTCISPPRSRAPAYGPRDPRRVGVGFYALLT